jgi:cobalt-zinc-cadmium efflux system outer membrane protein
VASIRRRIAIVIAAAVFATAGARPARAQQRLTLAAAVRFAIAHNPDLAMARSRADSAVAEVKIARSYPNPQLQATPGLPSTYSIAFPLDIGPQRHYRVISQRQGASAAAQDTSDVRRQLLFAVRQAYCDAELSAALYSIAGEQREIVREVLTADSARLRAGAIPLRDVVRSTVELSRADAAVARAGANSRATRVALQIEMGIADPDTGLVLSDTLDATELWAPPDSIIAGAATRRPDVQAAIERVHARKSDVSFARSLLLPTPDVGLVSQPHDPFLTGSHYGLAVGFGLPLVNWFSGERARAAKSLELAELARDRQTIQVRGELTVTLDSLNTARALLYRYQAGALALSDSALAMARYAYSSGATSLVDVFDALRTLSAVRADYVTALHDYRVSVFALRRAAGVEPEGPEQ